MAAEEIAKGAEQLAAEANAELDNAAEALIGTISADKE